MTDELRIDIPHHYCPCRVVSDASDDAMTQNALGLMELEKQKRVSSAPDIQGVASSGEEAGRTTLFIQ